MPTLDERIRNARHFGSEAQPLSNPSFCEVLDAAGHSIWTLSLPTSTTNMSADAISARCRSSFLTFRPPMIPAF